MQSSQAFFTQARLPWIAALEPGVFVLSLGLLPSIFFRPLMGPAKIEPKQQQDVPITRTNSQGRPQKCTPQQQKQEGDNTHTHIHAHPHLAHPPPTPHTTTHQHTPPTQTPQIQADVQLLCCPTSTKRNLHHQNLLISWHCSHFGSRYTLG